MSRWIKLPSIGKRQDVYFEISSQRDGLFREKGLALLTSGGNIGTTVGDNRLSMSRKLKLIIGTLQLNLNFQWKKRISD